MSGDLASCVERIGELTTQGDLVGAWRLLEAHRTSHSGDPGLLAATGRLLRLRGRHVDARVLLERTLHDVADNTRAQIELAYIARDLGETEAVHAWFEKAYRDHTQGEAWVLDWIDLLCAQGGFDLAQRVAAAYRERVPESARGWFCLGLAYQLGKRHDLALDAYERAMQLDQTVHMLRNNMAAAYIGVKNYDKAHFLLEKTLRDDPDNAFAWSNLACVLLESGDPATAQVAAERACALAPDYPIALQTYTNVLKELQDWDRAMGIAQRAVSLAPADARLVWSLAMLKLLRGDYATGWQDHEARWEGSPELRGTLPSLQDPRWAGQSLSGKTLFVWSEQGYGDVLQFVRFLPLIARHVRHAGGKLVFCCFANLVALVRRSLGKEVEAIVAHDQPLSWPGFDYQLPLASLPLMLGVTLDQLPVASRYLEADRVKVEVWRSRCTQAARRIKVGLAWSGSRTHQRNPLRSLDPLAFAIALGPVQGVEFISLQIGANEEGRAMCEAGLALTDPTSKLASFDDTAALLQSLDLVITVCTSVAHLAGALGVATWVLLDVNPHWVWMTGRSDSPWYPSIRLYRQQEYGQWEPVLARVARDLAAFAATATPQLVQRASV